MARPRTAPAAAINRDTIRYHMNRLGLSEAGLARALNASESAVRSLLHYERRNVGLARGLQLAAVLGIPPAALLAPPPPLDDTTPAALVSVGVGDMEA